LMLWLGCIGLVMGATTIGRDRPGPTITTTRPSPRTMGHDVVRVGQPALLVSASGDQLAIGCSVSTSCVDRKFLMFSGASLVAIIIAPQLNLLNRILGTVPLDAAPVADLHRPPRSRPSVASEIRKGGPLRRREACARVRGD